MSSCSPWPHSLDKQLAFRSALPSGARHISWHARLSPLGQAGVHYFDVCQHFSHQNGLLCPVTTQTHAGHQHRAHAATHAAMHIWWKFRMYVPSFPGTSPFRTRVSQSSATHPAVNASFSSATHPAVNASMTSATHPASMSQPFIRTSQIMQPALSTCAGVMLPLNPPSISNEGGLCLATLSVAASVLRPHRCGLTTMRSHRDGRSARYFSAHTSPGCAALSDSWSGGGRGGCDSGKGAVCIAERSPVGLADGTEATSCGL